VFIVCSFFLNLRMAYLLIATLFYSINDFLWSIYSKKSGPLALIQNRSIYTSIFVGLLFVFYSKDLGLVLEGTNSLKLLGVSSIGFMGLYFLVKGFQQGSIVQFCIYILLTTTVVGLISNFNNYITLSSFIPSLLCIGFGFGFFIYHQLKTHLKNSSTYKSHLYFMVAQLFFIVLVLQQYEYLSVFSAVDIAFYQELTVLLFSSLLLFLKKEKTSFVKQPVQWYEYFLIALPISIAQLSNLQGLQLTNPFYEKLFGLLGPVLSVVLAMVLAKERHQFTTYLAFIIMLIGYYFLGL